MKMDPLIISCPIVGAELTRKEYPRLPLTPDELADAAAGAVTAGATIIHLHVRDEAGKPTQRVDVFETVTRKIRDRCDCILQYSTGGAVGTPLSERCAPLALKPEMATLSMGTCNFGEEIYENLPETIREISRVIRENNIVPELEIFDYGMMETVERFRKSGVLPDKFHVDFVLGISGAMGGDIRNLLLKCPERPAGKRPNLVGGGNRSFPASFVRACHCHGRPCPGRYRRQYLLSKR